ncbi:hypothetical protein NMG60_11028916 [Bertholletia excelsa]
MDALNFVVISLLFSSFLPSALCSAGNDCPSSGCSATAFPVRFPFRLVGGDQPPHCAYPGFDLRCANDGSTILSLPGSGDFSVQYINYRAQMIQLYDHAGCLPRRLMTLNLSGSPFTAVHYVNYTFVSCPADLYRSRFTIIDCLSNSTNSTFAITSASLASMTTCKIIAAVLVPVPVPSRQLDGGLSSALDGDLLLTWNMPDCKPCEARGAQCGFKNSSSTEVVCVGDDGTVFKNNRPRLLGILATIEPTTAEYDDHQSSSNKTDGLQVFRVIAFSIAVPAIACSVGIGCCICYIGGSQHGDGNTAAGLQNSDPAAVSPQPTTVSGLDESTIESYTKVVLGESRRLPGPSDGSCPICLSDYSAKETVRCIPECEHCFHANCIDEWLRLNGTCPVCRNFPSHAQDNLQNA